MKSNRYQIDMVLRLIAGLKYSINASGTAGTIVIKVLEITKALLILFFLGFRKTPLSITPQYNKLFNSLHKYLHAKNHVETYKKYPLKYN